MQMAIPQQPFESLRERARRVLLDNPPPPPRVSGDPAPPAVAEAATAVPADVPRPMPAVMPVPAAPVAPSAGVPAAPAPVAGTQAATSAAPSPAEGRTEPADLAALVLERLKAIRAMQELLPKQTCSSQRVRELSHTLATTSGESVYYRSILDHLREAHEEWLDLEEQLWDADHIIRSTQWLMEMLAEPTRRGHGGVGRAP